MKDLYNKLKDLTRRVRLLERERPQNLIGSGARVYNSADISISNFTSTALTFNSERYDDGNWHDTVTNNSRITFEKDGRYSVGSNVAFASNIAGYRIVFISLNGSTIIAHDSRPAVVGNITYVNISCDYDFLANDYIEVYVFQNSGGSLNVLNLANRSPEFWAHRIK